MAALSLETLPTSTLESLTFAIVVTDLEGWIIYANPAAHELYGYAPGDLLGTMVTETLTPEFVQEHAAEIMATVTAGGTWTGQFPVRRADGTTVTLQVTDAPLRAGDEIVGVVGLAERLPFERHESLLLARLVDLAQMAAQVAAATTLSEAADVLTSRASAVLGADAASLSVMDGPGSLRLVQRRGPALAEDHWWSGFGVEERNSVSEAVRTGQAVTAATEEEIRTRWPGVFPAGHRCRSLAALPLVASERCVGAIGLTFPVEREFTPADRQFLGALADCCAQAVARITATESAADSAAKLQFLAESSEALSASLDYEATLRAVADLAVPRLADWCSIDLLEEGRLRRVAVSHIDPAKVALAWEAWERFPPDLDAPRGAGAVIRSGTSELLERVDDAVLDSMNLDDDLRRLIAGLQLSSAVTTPLTARGRTLGVISFVYAESGRRYGPDDIRTAELLARRAAVAIDNAQLHTDAVEASLLLQRAILPTTFADTDRWRVAVHYRPAGHTEVGGDFFDAMTRPDGRMVALVGDVMGRGIPAAATMAQVRAAIRGFVTDDADPQSVLGRVDTMFVDLDLTELVTVLYAVIDPVAGRLEVAHAGHLPPLLLRDGGLVETVALPASPPLGLTSSARPVVRMPFRATDTLVMYTDGLVERRGEDIGDGMDRLVGRMAGLFGRVSDATLAALADTMHEAGHDDDVTILAVHPL